MDTNMLKFLANAGAVVDFIDNKLTFLQRKTKTNKKKIVHAKPPSNVYLVEVEIDNDVVLQQLHVKEKKAIEVAKLFVEQSCGEKSKITEGVPAHIKFYTTLYGGRMVVTVSKQPLNNL
jgi:hypothetical protein